MNPNTICGIPFRYSIEAPEDAALIHPELMRKLLIGQDSMSDVYVQSDGAHRIVLGDSK